MTEYSKNCAMVTRTVTNSRAFQYITEICREYGIEIDHNNCRDDYKNRWQAAENLITWGVKWRNSYYKRGQKNVMFLENALLSQRGNMFIDTEGYFDGSAIVREKKYNDDYHPNEIDRAIKIAKDRFKWGFFRYKRNKGPIIVAMQMNGDASVRHCFPSCKKAKTSKRNMFFLQLLAEHNISNVKYIIRGHPREHGDNKTPTIEGGYPDNWEIDNSGNLYDIIPKCRAMITINSTCATEALSYGMPVATFGMSAYTGSTGTVLDCSRNHGKVASIVEYMPEQEAVKRYLSAVMRHQLSYNATKEEVLRNVSVRTFIARALDKSYNGVLKHDAIICVHCAYANPVSKCASCNGKAHCRSCGEIL